MAKHPQEELAKFGLQVRNESRKVEERFMLYCHLLSKDADFPGQRKNFKNP